VAWTRPAAPSLHAPSSSSLSPSGPFLPTPKFSEVEAWKELWVFYALSKEGNSRGQYTWYPELPLYPANESRFDIECGKTHKIYFGDYFQINFPLRQGAAYWTTMWSPNATMLEWADDGCFTPGAGKSGTVIIHHKQRLSDKELKTVLNISAERRETPNRRLQGFWEKKRDVERVHLID
jgi:hypothetical protein